MKNMHSLIHFICNSIPVVLIVVVVAVFIVLHKWKLIRENVMFSVFYLQWRTAKIEWKSNRIELPEKPHETRDSNRDRERERESALLCEWDASRMCTIQTSARCNSEKLPDAMKNLWKNLQLSRSITTLNRELLKRPTHIRIRSRIRIRTFAHTSALGVGPEEQRGPLRQASRIALIERPSLPLNIPLPLSLPQVQLPACVRRNRGRQIAGASLTSLRSSSTLCWD